jgi:hypothetical protein
MRSIASDRFSHRPSPETRSHLSRQCLFSTKRCSIKTPSAPRYVPESKKLNFDRANYFDKKGRENNRKLGIDYTDEDILAYVIKVCVVLLTRGVKGTFVYVCDPGLRAYLRRFFGGSE